MSDIISSIVLGFCFNEMLKPDSSTQIRFDGGGKRKNKRIKLIKNSNDFYKTLTEKIGKNISYPQKSFFKLPVRTVTIVPSTFAADKTISKKKMKKRVKEVYDFLAQTFGGFSATNVIGGYFSDNKNEVIEEKVVAVESYATHSAFVSNVEKWLTFVEQKGRLWKQEAMGIVVEDDMFYIGTDVNK